MPSLTLRALHSIFDFAFSLCPTSRRMASGRLAKYLSENILNQMNRL